MQAFLTTNRDFKNSPQLTFQYNRLQRAIDLEQGLYTTLAQSEQNAALDEVRNTPTLSVLDTAVVAAFPVSRHMGLRGVAGLLVGALATLLAILMRARMSEGAVLDGGVRLHAALDATKQDLRRIWKLGRAAQ